MTLASVGEPFVAQAKSLNILSIAMVVAGAATSALAPMNVAPGFGAWLAVGCFAFAAVAALASNRCMTRAASTLAADLETAAQGDFTAAPPEPPSAASDLPNLRGAAARLLQAANKAVFAASIKAKEIEIQLKIATAERQHAEAIIHSISDAVLVTDPFGELVLANESAARTFHFDLDRAQRSPVEQVLRDAKIVEMIRDIRDAGGREGRRVVEHSVATQAGRRTFKVTLSAIADEPADARDAAGGVVVVLHDLTQQKEIAQMKNDFVSSVSHELRTPLASIRAYVELLIDGEANDETTKREFYEVIQNEANRLGRLIDNILNISRIESGLVKIDKQPQSLAVIVKDALEVIAPQAQQKRISVTEELTPLFYQTLCDRDMLYQAVLNLLSNAVKYTPDGGHITVRTAVDEAKKKVIAKVIDTGVGIPPKDLPFVFDKFFRCAANSQMAKGTGLGLSLVKHIVETVHQGRMIVESEVGKGSCFGFELELCD